MSVVTRFAPSPTGYLHIGGVRTALYAWLYARRHHGKFILRIEDSDKSRSTDVAEQAILQGMQWLGLHSDVAVIRQSERLHRYRQVVAQLVAAGKAYYCDCSAERLNKLRQGQKQRHEKMRYDRHCRDLQLPAKVDVAVRLKTPLVGKVAYEDQVYGRIEVANEELDDLIIQRSNGMPTYNLAVVVDDLDAKVSHVIRGDDHINNTLRQLHLYHALAKQPPVFVHTPMVLGVDGTKLSKRHGAVSVLAYQQQGYLPQALLNYLLRLGWSSGDQELFTLNDMVAAFDFAGMNKSPPRFDVEKLRWFNQHYLATLDLQELMSILLPYLRHAGINIHQDKLILLLPLFQPRITTLVELVESLRFVVLPTINISATDWQQYLQPNLAYIQKLYARLQVVDAWSAESIMFAVKQLAKDLGIKISQLGMPLRLLLTGVSQSPDFSKIAAILGKPVVMQRLLVGLTSVKAQSPTVLGNEG